jgi:uncharacterized protein (DUF433 family)
MKKLLIYPLLFILSFFQLSANILENQYNALTGDISILTGDIEGTGLSVGTIAQFSNDGSDSFAFMFDFSHLNITDVYDINLFGTDLEQNSWTYGIGYIFKGDKTHFIPYFTIIDCELGVNGYLAAEYDGNSFGFMLRTIVSEKSVITYSFANTDLDNMTVLGTSVSVADVSPETSFGVNIENELSEDSTLNLGANFSDGTISLNFGLSLNF